VSSPQFNGRVGFATDMPSKDVSLHINNTQESDSGRYFCQVLVPNKAGVTAQLSLNVKGEINNSLLWLVSQLY